VFIYCPLYHFLLPTDFNPKATAIKGRSRYKIFDNIAFQQGNLFLSRCMDIDRDTRSSPSGELENEVFRKREDTVAILFTYDGIQKVLVEFGRFLFGSLCFPRFDEFIDSTYFYNLCIFVVHIVFVSFNRPKYKLKTTTLYAKKFGLYALLLGKSLRGSNH
jgi:hypothetical protein